MQMHHRRARPQSSNDRVYKLNLFAARHEDNDLLAFVVLQERPQQAELILQLADEIVLVELVRCNLPQKLLEKFN